MIYPLDAALLAYAKIRTRKIRLFITVFISCLLFTGLVAASLVVRGVFHSVESFGQEGLGKRYIVSASSASVSTFDLMKDPVLVERVKVLDKQYQDRRKAEAKRLGLELSPIDSRLSAVNEADGPNGKETFINPDADASQQALKEYLTTHKQAGEPELRAAADKYGVVGVYSSSQLLYGNPFSLQVLKDNKEDYDTHDKNFNPTQRGTDSFTSNWRLMSQELLAPFTLPGQTLEQADGKLPVLAPYTAVEQILGLEPLSPTASNQQKLTRLKTVRSRAAGLEFAVCYRNQTSTNLLTLAKTNQQEINQHKNDKAYQKPDLIYALPAEPCGPVRIERDARPAEQKKLAAKQEQFDTIFGKPAAQQTVLHFRIAGMVADPQGLGAISVNQIIGSLVGSSIGTGWFTPRQLAEQNPLVNSLFNDQKISFGLSKEYYAEFRDVATTKRFIENENCISSNNQLPGPPQQVISGGAVAVAGNCNRPGKYFVISGFGSSSLALDSLQRSFTKFFTLAALAFAGVASLILMGIVGKIIADSRRETAVFRAIGAKKVDIVQIYFTYALYLAVLICGASLLVGNILARVADAKLSPKVTVDALVAYNASDLSRRFSFFAWHGRDLLYIMALVVAACLLSACLPLLTNIRRNPIKDMRDEG